MVASWGEQGAINLNLRTILVVYVLHSSVVYNLLLCYVLPRAAHFSQSPFVCHALSQCRLSENIFRPCSPKKMAGSGTVTVAGTCFFSKPSIVRNIGL